MKRGSFPDRPPKVWSSGSEPQQGDGRPGHVPVHSQHLACPPAMCRNSQGVLPALRAPAPEGPFPQTISGNTTAVLETETTERRVAHNQNAFREANERIEKTADSVVADLEIIPFICECPQPQCTELARLKRHEYEMVRAHGDTFLVVPGHEVVEVDGVTIARVAEPFERFTLMKKIGGAGEIARELDPRS
jgi:hypothetical protein